MRSILKSLLFLSLCIFCIPNPTLRASEAMLESVVAQLNTVQKIVETLQTTVQSQNEVIQKQNIRIDALEKVKGITAPSNAVIPTPQGGPKIASLSAFNPDIGLVGGIQGKITENKADVEGNNAIALKELELNLSSYVDPYSRMDAIIAFNDNLEEQNVDIEEAYYTRWGLPFGFTGQIGKFRSKIGKQNLLHSHQLDTADYPIVIRDFFGDEGLASSGARLQNMIPNPWDIPVEITGEILRGNNGNSFSGISRRPIFNAHVKTFFNVSDDANVELGGTALFGDENPPITVVNPNGNVISYARPEGQDRYGVKIVGGDATVNVFLPEGRKLKWQNEIYVQNRTSRARMNDNPWGFYSLVNLQLSKQFGAGVRFDYVEPLDVNGDYHHTIGISPYLAFFQSEFADFRLQYSHVEPASDTEKPDNAILLKANVLIGAHKHPVQ